MVQTHTQSEPNSGNFSNRCKYISLDTRTLHTLLPLVQQDQKFPVPVCYEPRHGTEVVVRPPLRAVTGVEGRLVPGYVVPRAVYVQLVPYTRVKKGPNHTLDVT